MDLFLYDRGIRHERGNNLIKSAPIEKDNQAFARWEIEKNMKQRKNYKNFLVPSPVSRLQILLQFMPMCSHVQVG